MSSYYDEDIYEVAEEVPAPASQPCRYVPQKKKKKASGALLLVFALVFSLVGSALGAGGVLLAQGVFSKEETVQVTALETDTIHILQGQQEDAVIETVKVDTGRLMTPAEVYAANVNSTVGITTALNGTEVSGGTHLVELVQNAKAGDVLTLTVYRQGESLTISLTVSEHIQSALPEKEQPQYPGYREERPGGRH